MLVNSSSSRLLRWEKINALTKIWSYISYFR